ncbi:MAG: hypothetical protein J5507_04200 [Clostridia bacterium]|nr:hypothetical protein [Clostridia bacterium]
MAKTTTGLELKVSGERIVSANVLNNGICELTIKTTVSEEVSKVFKNRIELIEASKLRLDDKFMKYKPQTNQEKEFKKVLSEAIKSGLKDFYRPVLDPSFNDDMTGICYEFGKKPAVGRSYNWWVDTAKDFMPNSRLGIRNEYVAFLGVLIKKLVKNGWSISKSWRAVCTDSKELGHYWNSDNAKHAFEDTDSREVCGFYDLANTYKILAEDKEADGFWLAGGRYLNYGYDYPLAVLSHDYNRDRDHHDGVGWLVLDCNTYH